MGPFNLLQVWHHDHKSVSFILYSFLSMVSKSVHSELSTARPSVSQCQRPAVVKCVKYTRTDRTLRYQQTQSSPASGSTAVALRRSRGRPPVHRGSVARGVASLLGSAVSDVGTAMEVPIWVGSLIS